MKHIWSVLCQNSSIDKDTNLLSLLNTVEEITLNDIKLSKAGVIPVSFEAVSFWLIEDQKKDVILDISGDFVDPNGKILNKFERQINVPNGYRRFRNRIRMSGFRITEEGIYWLKLRQKEGKEYKLVAELPVEVKFANKEVKSIDTKPQ